MRDEEHGHGDGSHTAVGDNNNKLGDMTCWDEVGHALVFQYTKKD